MENTGNGSKKVNSRSFVVRLEGGRTIRRNRHQLRILPGQIPFQEDVLEESDVEDQEPEKEREDQRGQQQQVVTRSGRAVIKPVWQNDYVVDQREMKY